MAKRRKRKKKNSFRNTLIIAGITLLFIAANPSLSLNNLFANLYIYVSSFSGDAYSGYASFYADKYQGRLTSSGEVFDQNKLTAAHKTLPLGSKVKVTNLANGKSVVVKINDRGPFVPGRIIDLTHAAATRLAMTGDGVAEVKIDVIK